MKRISLIMTICLMVPGIAGYRAQAQVPEADYQRAEELRQEGISMTLDMLSLAESHACSIRFT